MQAATYIPLREITTMTSHINDNDFFLFTTFRLDSSLVSDASHTAVCGGHKSDVYLLPYHFDRLKLAAATIKGFHCPEAMSSLEAFEREVHAALEKSQCEESIIRSDADVEAKQAAVSRGKVSWWPSGRLEVTLIPSHQPFPILLPKSFDDIPDSPWTVLLDDQPTETDLYLGIKTSYRKAYDRARQSGGIDLKSTKEVLLYNRDGDVVDGSITTAYFYRDNKWVTPQSGGLEGTTRRFALESGLCSTATPSVNVESLKDGETIWLSNAFRGFYAATFRTR